jgi:hypothetical protein
LKKFLFLVTLAILDTGRRLNFADYDRLYKLEKRGDEILKKSSPRKLLSQLQPNFAEMILGWPPSKIVSGDPDFQLLAM